MTSKVGAREEKTTGLVSILQTTLNRSLSSDQLVNHHLSTLTSDLGDCQESRYIAVTMQLPDDGEKSEIQDFWASAELSSVEK